MTEITQTIIEIITKLFGDNYIDFLIYMSLLFVIIWLFKEFKNKVDNEEKNKNEKIETILTVLIDLKFEVKDFYSNRGNFSVLKEKLAKAAPYVSYELCQDIYKFSREVTETKIKEFINQLSEEIDAYKREQNDEILHLNKKTIEGILKYYYKSMLRPIVLSVSLTYFSVLIGVFLLFILFAWFQLNSIWDKYYLVQELTNSILFISLLISVIDSAITKKLNWDKKAWVFIVSLLICSAICSIFFSKIPFLSTINFILYILYPILTKKFQVYRG